MYKKWRFCLCLLLCLCCTYFTLFSSTLVVKADESYSFSTTFYPSDTASQSSGYVSGYISNGTGTVTGSVVYNVGESYCYHVSIPFYYISDSSNIGVSNLWPDYADKYFTLGVNRFSITSNSGTISNVCLYDSNGKLVYTTNSSSAFSYIIGTGATFRYDRNNSKFQVPLVLEYDVSYVDYYSSTSGTFIPESWSSNISFSMNVWGRQSNDYEIAGAKTQVVDTAANQSLDAIEQSSQAIATSVTSDTGGGLLATIKNFFGGFFTNIFNTILSLFVPDQTYFSTWFDNLNTLLSDKLGMLYAPFDLLISTLNAVYSADTTEPGITFPGITWDGETVIEPYTFYFSSLGEDFQNLRDAVYFATDVVFLFAFLHLLQKKIALVITGSEVNG